MGFIYPYREKRTLQIDFEYAKRTALQNTARADISDICFDVPLLMPIDIFQAS